MKHIILAVACFLGLGMPTSHTQHSVHHSQHQPLSFVSREDARYVDPYTVRTDRLTVRAMDIQGFDPESLRKLEAAFAIVEEVMNSEEFKEAVLNFKNTKGERAFASNRGLSNEQILTQLMEGREVLQPHTPGEMNFFLRLYNNRWSRVIGYTSPKTNVISINWKFFRNFAPHQVAGNLAHEWAHKMGYDHVSAKEHDSVPYAVGYLVESLGAKLLKTGALH
jgi:hypothetical protein